MNIRKKLRNGLLNENRIPFKLDLPNDIYLINDVFKQNGFELYVVGGSIRDALVNKSPKDWDLATNADPDAVIRILKPQKFITNIIETGKSFGVINALTDNDEYEIATFRTDGNYSDARRPDSVEFSTIDQDAKRRDLTINALYYDINTGEIVDLVGGVDDIKNGIVRTVGDANERFTEDRLRVLRAIRFAARFGTQLSDEIKDSLKNDNNLSGVSPERIRDEFLKGIKTASNVVYFLRLLDAYGLFKFIFPGLIVNNTKFTETKMYKPLIALLLSDNQTNKVTKTLNKQTYSADETKAIGFLLELKDFTPENVYVYRKALENVKLTYDEIIFFATKMGLDINLVKGLLNFKLTVTGADLIKQGIKPGPEMGVVMKKQESDNFKKFIG